MTATLTVFFIKSDQEIADPLKTTFLGFYLKDVGSAPHSSHARKSAWLTLSLLNRKSDVCWATLPPIRVLTLMGVSIRHLKP